MRKITQPRQSDEFFVAINCLTFFIVVLAYYTLTLGRKERPTTIHLEKLTPILQSFKVLHAIQAKWRLPRNFRFQYPRGTNRWPPDRDERDLIQLGSAIPKENYNSLQQIANVFMTLPTTQSFCKFRHSSNFSPRKYVKFKSRPVLMTITVLLLQTHLTFFESLVIS